jgi:C-terminal processing protease CtpA/Prc
LERGSRFADDTPVDMSGLTIERINGETKVRAVQKGMPASIAGIVEGDRITAVGNVPAADVSLHRLRRILSDEDGLVRLTVQREGHSRRVELRLLNSLEPCVLER